MNDDELLQAAAARVRDQRASEPDRLWDRYAAGDLSDQELQALLASQHDERAADLQAAFEPLGDDFENNVIATILADPSEPASAEPDEVRPERRQRSRRWALPFAIAAAFMIVSVGMTQLGGFDTASPTIPGYEFSLRGGSTYRSEGVPEPVSTYRSDDFIEIRLIPETALGEPVSARVYVQTGQAAPIEARADVRVAESGAIRIRGRARQDFGLTVGSAQLIVVSGRVDHLPSVSTLLGELDDKKQVVTDHWRAWRQPVRVVENP